MCAVCDSATHPLILNSDVVQKLQHMRSVPIIATVECIDDGSDEEHSKLDETACSANESRQTETDCAVNDENGEIPNGDNASIQSLITEQVAVCRW